MLVCAADIEPKPPPTADEMIAAVEARRPDLDVSGFLDASRRPSSKLSAETGIRTAISASAPPSRPTPRELATRLSGGFYDAAVSGVR